MHGRHVILLYYIDVYFFILLTVYNIVFIQTIFEINSTKKKGAFEVMKQKRKFHGNLIANVMKKREDTVLKDLAKEDARPLDQEMSSQEDIEVSSSRR